MNKIIDYADLDPDVMTDQIVYPEALEDYYGKNTYLYLISHPGMDSCIVVVVKAFSYEEAETKLNVPDSATCMGYEVVGDVFTKEIFFDGSM